jgi:protein-tyrosine kinase
VGKVSKALHKAGTKKEPDEEAGEPLPGAQQTLLTPKEEIPRVSLDEEPSDDDRMTARNRIHPSVQPAPDHFDDEQEMEKWDERLVLASEKFSGVAESFRKLRTILSHPETGPPARTIMVLSADPQEGKSFVSANLGISLAHGVGRQALLIDCDLRRPSLHTLFGLTNDQGLVDYLRGGRDISSFMVTTGLANLTLVPAGPPPDNPAEMVASGKMADLMQDLTRGAGDRLTVLDSPPFLAASETMILAQMVDRVVLVVRWGKTGRDNVKKVIDQLGREKILGIVFNAFEMNVLDRKIQGVGYHNYYSESYY